MFYKLGSVPSVVTLLAASIANSALCEAALTFLGNCVLQLGDEVKVTLIHAPI